MQPTSCAVRISRSTFNPRFPTPTYNKPLGSWEVEVGSCAKRVAIALMIVVGATGDSVAHHSFGVAFDCVAARF